MNNSNHNELANTHQPNCNVIQWNNIPSSLRKNKFSILCTNMKSMHNKFSEFKVNITASKTRFSFIILTETWITKDRDYAYDIDGYKCISLYRDNDQRGGGIKLYYLENIAVSSIDNETGIFQHCEQFSCRFSSHFVAHSV